MVEFEIRGKTFLSVCPSNLDQWLKLSSRIADKWVYIPNICLSNIWLCAPEYMALCPFNIWPCAPQYMSKQYMALCPPIYALCPSFCNVVKRYVLSNLDATSHWISAYLKRISTCRLTLKCQATGSILLSKVLCECDLTINRSLFSCNYFCFVIPEARTVPNPHTTFEYLVGKDILWNLDSEYLRSIRHKKMLIKWENKSEGVIW